MTKKNNKSNIDSMFEQTQEITEDKILHKNIDSMFDQTPETLEQNTPLNFPKTPPIFSSMEEQPIPTIIESNKEDNMVDISEYSVLIPQTKPISMITEQNSKDKRYNNSTPKDYHDNTHNNFNIKVKKSRIIYEDCIALGYSRDDIDFAMTREQFNNAIRKGREKRIPPSQVKLTWTCLRDEKHGRFPAIYSSVKGTRKKKGSGCSKCSIQNSIIHFEDYTALGNSRDDIDSTMTREQFNDAIKKGREKGKFPSHIKFIWTCLRDEEHGRFPAIYKDVKGTRNKKGSGCPKCRVQDLSIHFEDCTALGNSRDDIDFAMTRKQFNDTIKMGKEMKIGPNKVKLTWTCLKDREHGTFPGAYGDVKGTPNRKGTGCPRCNEIQFEDCIALGNSRDDIDFAMTREQFNGARKKGKEKRIGPNKVKLTWMCLRDEEHGRFPAAYSNVNGTPNSKGTGCPKCGDIFNILCIHVHTAIKYIVSSFLHDIGIKSYSEILVSRIFEDFCLRDCIIDSFLLNINCYLENRILNSSKLLHELRLEGINLRNIKGFLFDYTADVSDKNIKSKIRKYQKKDMFLFIVGTKWKKNKKERIINTIYKNVRVIRYDLFSELIGFKDKFLDKFKQMWKMFDNDNLGNDSLEDLYNFKEKLQSEFFKKSGTDLFRKNDLETKLKSLNIDYYSFFGID